MDLIKRFASPLPILGGLWWRLHRSCSSKASKLDNSINLDWDTYLCKTIQLFYVFTLNNSWRVLIKGHKSFIQNQNMRDACICLQAKENHLGTFVTKPPPQNHLRTKFQLLIFVQNSLILIKRLNFDQSMFESIKNPGKIQ